MVKRAFTPLPPLQVQALCVLLHLENSLPPGHHGVTGPILADELSKQGAPKSYPAFYYLMGRLKTAKLVDSRLEEEILGPYRVKQTFFSITEKGKKACVETLNWYKENALMAGLETAWATT